MVTPEQPGEPPPSLESGIDSAEHSHASSTSPPPSAAVASATRDQTQHRFLLLSVAVVATCGLVYELISATMASYLLGDSVTQWSLVIGVYLSAMGLGSWLSKSIERELHSRFIGLQLGIAVIGGGSAAALFLGFAYLSSVRPLLFGILFAIGTMVGLEIPLLMRIMQQGQTLRDLVARVLAFDYLGSLAASVLFPLLLLPHLGLVRTSLVFGTFNAAIALWATYAFASELRTARRYRVTAAGVLAVLAAGVWQGEALEDFGESELYEFPVIFSEKTAYQRLTITKWREDLRLYIDGNLQFSSVDEHRYHEALVHPVMAVATARNHKGLRVVVLGGGDGLAVRELVRYPEIASIDLVDLDPRMTELFAAHPMLAGLNDHALADPRVSVHAADAMEWLMAERAAAAARFDVAIVDLPDPNNFSLGKLYSRAFYRLLGERLGPRGVAVVQSTSPYLSPRAFWCIVGTLEAAQLHPRPYHAHVPSFGEWGFTLASRQPISPPLRLVPSIEPRFLNDAMLPGLFVFSSDEARLDVEINRLNDQLLVHYYEADLEDPVWAKR